jgi:hypothetical protein
MKLHTIVIYIIFKVPKIFIGKKIYIYMYTGCPKKIVPFFYFIFLGAQCVESGVSCTDCY